MNNIIWNSSQMFLVPRMKNGPTKGPVIQKNFYNPPEDLILLLTSMDRISCSEFLNMWVPSVDSNYVKHFHNLLYLEEIGLRKAIKETYNQIEAYFCCTETLHRHGKVMKRKYSHGIYDLEVKDLFETRPSLQIGDRIVARKLSALHIPYKGYLTEIKESDLICVKFNNEFVRTFDSTAYNVDFDFSRSTWIRMHYALDLAMDIYGIDYLIPNKIMKRDSIFCDVHLSGDGRLKKANGKTINWFMNDLNFYQKQTVVNVLRADLLNPYLIYGPPGTGKTTTLVEIILKILTNIENSKILITTHSNSAANHIVQRLIKYDQVNTDNLLRLIGFNYGRTFDDIEIKDYASTIDNLLPNSASHYFDRLKAVKRFKIVVGTSTTIAKLLDSRDLYNHFTHAIVDEAGQSSELGVLISMALVGINGQTVMAGDPMQMPPIAIDIHAKERGLCISMLSRLLDCYSHIETATDDNRNANISCLVSNLIYNYRSLPSVLDFYNTQFYNSKLIGMIDGEKSYESKLLKFISPLIFDRSNDFGIYFINVDGQNVKRNNSYCNPYEISVIQFLVDKLKPLGLSDDSIGIITPYSLQVRQIESKLSKMNIRVGTVEDFQGLERKITLISTVRTCPDGIAVDTSRHLGFIKCPKRINVAVSRARVMVVVIGKESLLSADDNWNNLIQRCKSNGTFGLAHVEICAGEDCNMCSSRCLLTQKIEML